MFLFCGVMFTSLATTFSKQYTWNFILTQVHIVDVTGVVVCGGV